MEQPLTKNIRPGEAPLDLTAYAQAGGYQALRKALRGMTPSEVTEVVKGAKPWGIEVVDVERDVVAGPVRVARMRSALVRCFVLEQLDIRAAAEA